MIQPFNYAWLMRKLEEKLRSISGSKVEGNKVCRVQVRGQQSGNCRYRNSPSLTRVKQDAKEWLVMVCIIDEGIDRTDC